MLSFIPFKIPIILVLTILILIIIRITLKKGSTGYYEAIDNFLERENKANSVTKNFNTLDLNYIVASEDMFPFKEYEHVKENENIIKLQEIVRKKIPLKMIKFEKLLSNTELKEMYGINNFDKILLYEDHFKGFMSALYNWAKELYNIKNLEDSKKVLLASISLKADISRIYTLLADIYLIEKNFSELDNLKELVKNSSISVKNKTLEYINNLT